MAVVVAAVPILAAAVVVLGPVIVVESVVPTPAGRHRLGWVARWLLAWVPHPDCSDTAPSPGFIAVGVRKLSKVTFVAKLMQVAYGVRASVCQV